MMPKHMECSAFLVSSEDGRVVVLARNDQDARLAANAKAMYKALSAMVYAKNEWELFLAKEEAAELLEKMGERVD